MANRSLQIAAGLAALALTSAAHAQSVSTNSASFNAGWGRSPGQDNTLSIGYGRDANGNRVIIDGVIQTGVDQSSFSRTDLSGVSSSASGAGAGSSGATAIGNNLTVITQGNYNTVIVDSTQINNGNVSADAAVTTPGTGG